MCPSVANAGTKSMNRSLRREPIFGAADLGIEGKHERVLEVELQLVALELGQPIRQQLQGIECRHLAAGDVVEQPTGGKVRPVENLTACDPPVGCRVPHQLAKRLHAVMARRRVFAGDLDPVRPDREAVGMGVG